MSLVIILLRNKSCIFENSAWFIYIYGILLAKTPLTCSQITLINLNIILKKKKLFLFITVISSISLEMWFTQYSKMSISFLWIVKYIKAFYSSKSDTLMQSKFSCFATTENGLHGTWCFFALLVWYVLNLQISAFRCRCRKISNSCFLLSSEVPVKRDLVTNISAVTTGDLLSSFVMEVALNQPVAEF